MTVKAVMAAFSIAIAVLQAVTPASAGGPNDDPPCVLPNPPGGAALRGTIAAGVQLATPTPVITSVDFTLRLERGGAMAFFRASVPMQVSGISNEGILCNLLNDPAGHPAALTLREKIRAAFGFQPTAQFFLIERSLSKTEIQGSVGQWFCDGTWTNPDPFAVPPCPSPRGSAMADVLIYVK